MSEPKVLRFDEENMSRGDILSADELKHWKSELAGLTALLETGKATDSDKENARVLNTALKRATDTHTKATTAKNIDVAELVASMRKNKAELSAKLETLKDRNMGDEERSARKKECTKLKDAIKDSIEITKIRDKLEKKTQAKFGIETHVKGNLESALRARKIVVCFMMDCTGSMQSCIDEVKSKIHDVASKFAKLYSDGNIHYAFLGYRDFCDSEQFLLFNFTADVTEFSSYVGEVRADGGGDEAEDVVGALNKAKDMNWDVAGPGSSRVLIHIADAPPHGSKYHGTDVNDDYADTDTPGGVEGKNATPPLRYLKAKHVHYFFCPPQKHKCTQMVRAFNSDLGSQYVEMRELQHIHQLGDTIFKTLSTSVMRTVASGRAALTHKLHSLSPIDEEEADDGKSQISEPAGVESAPRRDVSFTSCPAHTVKVYQIKPPSSLASLRSAFVPISCQVMHRGRDGTTTMKWQSRAFAKGSLRWAFYGELNNDAGFQPYVMKRFQGESHTRRAYMQGIEESSIAQFLADQYASHKSADLQPIRYLTAYVLETQQMPHEYLFGEPQLPERPFTKWANNAGDWDVSHLNRSLLEFAKFSYDATGGYLMVSDLQGVDNGHEIILTDPVVLCKDIRKYQPTNLGPDAMKANYHKITVLLNQFF